MLELRNITIHLKKDGRCIADDFCFTLKSGEKAAIIGEEGNGKSTLLKYVYEGGCYRLYADNMLLGIIKKYIADYDEVESISLMSGGYDLAVTVRCRNIKEVSMFVAQRLATIDGVISTSTHFFLQKYKENGILLVEESPDERGKE